MHDFLPLVWFASHRRPTWLVAWPPRWLPTPGRAAR